MIEIDGRWYEWDKGKNLANIKKHGISFKMAASAFLDTYSVIDDDLLHSQLEDRFVLIGLSKTHELLVVCHCYRIKKEKEVVRIISARQATEQEKEYYEEERQWR